MNEFILQQIEQVCLEYQCESETDTHLLFINENEDWITINKVTGQYWDENSIAFGILGFQFEEDSEEVHEVEMAIKLRLMAHFYTRDKDVELTNFALLLISILTDDETKETGFCLENLNEMLTENHEHGDFTKHYTGYINYLAKSFLVYEYIRNAEQQPAV